MDGIPATDGLQLESLAVEMVSIDSILPSPENDALYGKISPTDKTFKMIVKSIGRDGFLGSVLVSSDTPLRFLIDGHRRTAAARAAGLREIPCRTHPILRSETSTADWTALLAKFNYGQRVKTPEQGIRESLAIMNPDVAYDEVAAYRAKNGTSSNSRRKDRIALGRVIARCGITPAKEPFLRALLKIIETYKGEGPLTERQFHYLLLNNPPLTHASKPDSRYENDKSSNKKLSNLMSRALIHGRIPWTVIHDPTRPVDILRTYPNAQPFVDEEADDFLKGYYRDYQQSQPHHIEVVSEKLTVLNILRQVTRELTIPQTVSRGYCSMPPRHGIAERYRASGKERLYLIVMSDHDPDGCGIAESLARSMRDDFGIENITAIKAGITPEQIKRFKLPPNNLEAKKKSSRYDAFVAKYGDKVYELEALSPTQLRTVLREAIDRAMDIDILNREIAAEKKDFMMLKAYREQIRGMISSVNLDE